METGASLKKSKVKVLRGMKRVWGSINHSRRAQKSRKENTMGKERGRLERAERGVWERKEKKIN